MEDERPPVETVSRRLVTPAGLWDDPLKEADLLERPDRPSDPRFREVEVAMADERPAVDREGQPEAPRRAPVASQEHGEDERRLTVLGRR